MERSCRAFPKETQKENDRVAKERSQTENTRPTNNDKKKKLSFNERREFEQLEKDIENLEKEKATLETAMSSGTLNTEDLLSKSERITRVIDELDEKTMRWLELSEFA
jgi:ATP-binding cassette subfamily F protein uup